MKQFFEGQYEWVSSLLQQKFQTGFVHSAVGQIECFHEKLHLPQMEQMALDHLQKHGSISRAGIASLCKIEADQAYRLLSS